MGLSLKQNLVMMVTLVARSVLVNTMAALYANLALLTGAKAEPNNYGRGGGGQGEARAGPRPVSYTHLTLPTIYSV